SASDGHRACFDLAGVGNLGVERDFAAKGGGGRPGMSQRDTGGEPIDEGFAAGDGDAGAGGAFGRTDDLDADLGLAEGRDRLDDADGGGTVEIGYGDSLARARAGEDCGGPAFLDEIADAITRERLLVGHAVDARGEQRLGARAADLRLRKFPERVDP